MHLILCDHPDNDMCTQIKQNCVCGLTFKTVDRFSKVTGYKLAPKIYMHIDV